MCLGKEDQDLILTIEEIEINEKDCNAYVKEFKMSFIFHCTFSVTITMLTTDGNFQQTSASSSTPLSRAHEILVDGTSLKHWSYLETAEVIFSTSNSHSLSKSKKDDYLLFSNGFFRG